MYIALMMEQGHTGPCRTPHVLCLPFACGKLQSRVSLIRKVRNVGTKENSQRTDTNHFQELPQSYSNLARVLLMKE